MNNVTSIVDVGCGDWQSSRYISFNGALYSGFDIVKSVVEANRKQFGSNVVLFDVMPDDPRNLPGADLLIIKDVLQHLTNDQILFYRDHVIPKYRLCLITNSWKAINYPQNGDIAPGQFRSLDLIAAPYSFEGAYIAEAWNEWERIRTMLLTNR
jgi:SAM-dependent methyltransferase